MLLALSSASHGTMGLRVGALADRAQVNIRRHFIHQSSLFSLIQCNDVMKRFSDLAHRSFLTIWI